MDGSIVVVGAGPVGLAVAGLLQRRGVAVTVLEREQRRTRASQAIGVTPPSLEILDEIGCAEELIARGVRIESAVVHNERRRLGALGFGGLGGRFPFILAVPQHHTEDVLRARLGNGDGRCAHMRYGVEVEALEAAPGDRTAAAGTAPDPGEQSSERARPLIVHARGPGEPVRLGARAVVVCAGARDRLAPALGIKRRRRVYGVSFAMGDFRGDPHGLGPEAHLFFTADGAVESFPLGPQLRRWIVQLPPHPREHPGRADKKPADEAAEVVAKLVRLRTGLPLRAGDCTWDSGFTPERTELEHFVLQLGASPAGRASGSGGGPVVFAGDAAHTMPPIGGQGMNTGFADAARAVEMLCGEISPTEYERRRKRAFRAAARRARTSMAVGTVRGRVRSSLRAVAITAALRSPAAGPLARTYAMRSLPDTRSGASDEAV